MRLSLTPDCLPGWYQCRDRLGRIVIRFWDGARLKNYPDAEWAWQPGTCTDYLGPLLPAGVFAAVLPIVAAQRPGLLRRLWQWLSGKR